MIFALSKPRTTHYHGVANICLAPDFAMDWANSIAMQLDCPLTKGKTIVSLISDVWRNSASVRTDILTL